MKQDDLEFGSYGYEDGYFNSEGKFVKYAASAQDDDLIIETDDKAKKRNKSGTVFGIIFLVWFIASLGGLIYCAQHGMESLLLVILGQYFIVFGFLAVYNCVSKRVKNKTKKYSGAKGRVNKEVSNMYDVDTKNIKKSNRFFLAFLITGIVLLIIMGGILVRNYLKFKSLDSEVLSTSVEIYSYYDDDDSVQYSPIYHYVVDGKSYTCSSNFSSNHSPGTENKIIYYDSKDPANSMSEYDKSSNGFLLVFMIIPLSFIFVAIFNMRKISKSAKQKHYILPSGSIITLYDDSKYDGKSFDDE